MTVFCGARDIDDAAPLNRERLARMAEADHFLPGLARQCRRSRSRQMVARWLAFIGAAVGAAWLLSDIAVFVLLDEARLAAIGIVAP